MTEIISDPGSLPIWAERRDNGGVALNAPGGRLILLNRREADKPEWPRKSPQNPRRRTNRPNPAIGPPRVLRTAESPRPRSDHRRHRAYPFDRHQHLGPAMGRRVGRHRMEAPGR
jgi:hypothetical protein